LHTSKLHESLKVQSHQTTSADTET
jgi:hypothetical protein